MLRWLRGNPGTLLLSVFLAVLIWYVATIELARPTLKRITPGIPLEVRNQGPNLALEGPADPRVEVVVRAPQAEEVRPGDFQAWVDLEGLAPGVHQVPVQVSCPRCPQALVQVVSYSPEEIEFSLEAHLQKTFPIRAVIRGSVPAGYQALAAELSPSEVTVSGPETQVERVDRVEVQFSIDGLRQTLEQPAVVVPLTREGETVRDVELSPEQVRVRVPIERRRGFKDVAVSANPVGTVAEGYWVSNITVEPPVVTIFGDPETIEDVPGFVSTETVSIEAATEDVVERSRLVLPEGVQALDVRTVVVTIEVQALQGGTSLRVPVEFVGLRPGHLARASPEGVQVFLSGPLPALQELSENPDDVRVVVDLERREPGTYIFQPRVEKPAELEVESIVPTRVEVVVEAEATPTPTAEPSG